MTDRQPRSVDGYTAPRTLVLANQKGGVGKTTTAINLGTALAAIQNRVLIIDLDPQGNASTGLGIDRKARRLSTYDLMIGEAALVDIALQTLVPNLDIAPSTLDLLGVELAIAQDKDRNIRLRTALSTLAASSIRNRNKQGESKRMDGADLDYDYILIDCPPSLNLLTINALTAADSILVPLQCEFFALEGLSQLLSTVDQVKRNLNPNLTIHGIVMTMFDKRNNLSNQVVADVRAFMGDTVYNTIIPRNVRVSEAPSYGKPALLYDVDCAGSQAYVQLATEIVRRERVLCAA